MRRPRRLDRQAQVDETEDQDEGAGGAEEERRVVKGAKHVASLLDEAAAGPCALRALPAGPQLLERRRCPRLINVTTVGAQPLSRPVALLLELLLGTQLLLEQCSKLMLVPSRQMACDLLKQCVKLLFC